MISVRVMDDFHHREFKHTSRSKTLDEALNAMARACFDPKAEWRWEPDMPGHGRIWEPIPDTESWMKMTHPMHVVEPELELDLE